MIDETVKTALYLLSNVINGRKADKNLLADCDLRALLEFAVSNSISSALGIALEDAGALSGSQYEGKWLQEKFRAMRKRMLMDGETAAVENAFRASGIRYMIMKGGTLCRYYPKPEMREMADCDVLIGERDYDRAAEIMRSLGYGHDGSDERADQRAYSKPPFFSFELHFMLYPKENGRIYGYYSDVWERLKTDDGVRYYFSDEDFYVYSIVHTYKHYSGTGTGLRSLLDVYVLNNLFGEKYDRRYIEDETAKLGISDFERMLRELSAKVFGGGEYTLTEEEEETVAYFAGSGTYGNSENRVANAFRTKYAGKATGLNKVKYVLSRLFPSAKWFKANYPACEKHPVLIPFYAVRRLLVTGIRRKDAVMNELDAVMKAETSGKEE